MEVKRGVSKAEAARQLGVSKPRITQLVRAGMPALADGSINLVAARQWIETRLDPLRRQAQAEVKHQRQSVAAAERREELRRGPFGQIADLPEPHHRGFALAAQVAIYRSVFHAVYSAADAGVGRDQARELAQTLQVVLWAELDDYARLAKLPAADASGDVLTLQSEILADQLDKALNHGGLFDEEGRSVVVGQSRMTPAEMEGVGA